MKSSSFQYSRAADVSDAFIQGSRSGAAYVAGGTDLLQLWKAGAMAPEGVVDISRLPGPPPARASGRSPTTKEASIRPRSARTAATSSPGRPTGRFVSGMP